MPDAQSGITADAHRRGATEACSGAQAQNGSTALHNAAAGGHTAIAKLLVAAGCDCDIQNANGNTALHIAASKGFVDIVEEVLCRADVHIKNSKASTALVSAASGGHFEVVLRLVAAGASWRQKADCDTVKLICKKSSYKCADPTLGARHPSPSGTAAPGAAEAAGRPGR
jgi:Ankyrin repeats (many copies)